MKTGISDRQPWALLLAMVVRTAAAFIFSTSPPGAIVNFGHLGLQLGQDLTFIEGNLPATRTCAPRNDGFLPSLLRVRFYPEWQPRINLGAFF